MSTLCFGTFFTLLCGNKIDWDKSKKPEVSNRILYFGLLDIVDKHSNPKHYVDKAKSNANTGYKDDVASDAKLCKRDDHPIQRDGSIAEYRNRFMEHHKDVWVDFYNYINEYIDEKQRLRLALSVIELIKDSDMPENEPLFILDSPSYGLVKKDVADDKRDYNLPCLLAGVLFYILDKNVPNGSEAAKKTLTRWKNTFTELPNCPTGETVDTVGEVTLDLPTEDSEEDDKSDTLDEEKSEQSLIEKIQTKNTPDSSDDFDYKDDYYNLCVYGQYEPGESFLDSGCVVIIPSRALGTYLKDEVKSIFGNLNDKATLSRIKTLPSIFACENNFVSYPNQEAVYGFITDVKVRDNGVKVYFDKVMTIPQIALTNISFNLAVNQYEWTHSHWTIKKINLCEELRTAGLLNNSEATNMTQTGRDLIQIGHMSGGVVMKQSGNNSIQIPNISGGTNTFNLGGDSSRTAKSQESNSTDTMIEIFRKAIVEFKIMRFIKADPSVSLTIDLPVCVDGFVEHIEDEIINSFIHCQRNHVYKTIREFNKSIDAYNDYLSNNMSSNGGQSDILTPQFHYDGNKNLLAFREETEKRRKIIDKIYGEILDGETLFV